jgi:hypothetical protein
MSVKLIVSKDINCDWCKVAEELLKSKGVKFEKVEESGAGIYPRIVVNGVEAVLSTGRDKVYLVGLGGEIDIKRCKEVGGEMKENMCVLMDLGDDR